MRYKRENTMGLFLYFVSILVIGHVVNAQECVNDNLLLTVADPTRFGSGAISKVETSSSHLVFGSGSHDDHGSVTLFEWDGNAWGDEQVIINPAGDGDLFGSVFSISGDHLAVTSYGFKVNSVVYGTVYTYKWDGNNWVSTTVVLPTLPAQSYFGTCVAVDGNRMVVGASFEDSQKGALYTFEWSGTQWTQSGSKLIRPSGSSGDRFGHNCELSGDYLAISSPGSGQYGEIVTLTRSGTTWVEDTSSPIIGYVTSNAFHGDLSLDGDRLIFGSFGYNLVASNAGIIRTFKRSGSSWVSTGEFLGQNANDRFGQHVEVEGGTLVTTIGTSSAIYVRVYTWDGSSWNQFEDISNPAGVVSDSFGATSSFFEGTTIIICSKAGNGLGASYRGSINSFTCNFPQPCTTHFECAGTGTAGFLPFCGTSNYCEDSVFEGTCTNTVDCENKISLKETARDSIGVLTHHLTHANLTLSRDIIGSLKAQTISSNTLTQDIAYKIAATEKVYLGQGLFDQVGNDQAIHDAIAEILFGLAGKDVVSVSQVDGVSARRALQSSGEVEITVTYEVDGTVYDSFPTGSFDSPSFASALEAALSLGTGDVTVLDVDGTISITYVVTNEATGDDPLSEDNFNELNDLAVELATIESTIQTQFGLNDADLSTASVDKCGDRDCNGRGTCDPATGVCLCDSTDYWGINCETLVDCTTGTNVGLGGVAYCECPYPNSGQRCTTTNACVGCV